MQPDGSSPNKQSATVRARQRWAGVAREVRYDLRAMGVTGSLKDLDRQVVGARGRKVGDGVQRMANLMFAEGVAIDRAKRILYAFADDIVDVTYGVDVEQDASA